MNAREDVASCRKLPGRLRCCGFLLTVACLLVLVPGCTELPPLLLGPCVFGECPPALPGVKTNTLAFEKSRWFDAADFGGPLRHASGLCTVEARQSPGLEVLLRGADAVSTIEVNDGEPGEHVRIPWMNHGDYSELTLHDWNQDGNVAYVIENFSERQAGSTDFFTPDGSRIVRVPNYRVFWEAVDLYADGVFELVVGGAEGSAIWDQAGNRIFEFPTRGRLTLADLDADGEPEMIIASGSAEAPGTLAISSWELDGTQIDSFELSYNDSSVFAAALMNDPSRHYIGIDCALYAPDGKKVSFSPGTWLPVLNGVTTVFEGEDGFQTCYLFTPFEESREVFPDCRDEAYSFEYTAFARFRASARPYRIDITYSVVESPSITPGFTDFLPVQTIIRIRDTNSELVYHEVLNTRSGMGSFAIIPARQPDAQQLLVAGDDVVWSYRLPD